MCAYEKQAKQVREDRGQGEEERAVRRERIMLHLHHHAEPSYRAPDSLSNHTGRGEASRYRERQRWDVGQEGIEKESE